jgi:superfamily II DNA or RNA helicase
MRRPSYEELARTVDELREDNARLRGLLGFDARAGDGHRRAWAPTLLSEPAERPVVDASASEAEKVALLRGLFGARSDVYATRWENASTGKSGWSPAMRGAWSKRRSSKDHLPLTDDVFLAQLRGEQTVGIYPLLAGDRCALLACDFDKGTWALDALAYLDACHANGVPAVLERSRSGNGAHVWVFFDGSVPAAEARAMGAALLRQAMTARAELDLASYDRFFPSQDFLPKAGYGNLIALPLQGECARRGTTVFLDPTSLEPWADQWAFLSSTARMSPDAVTALAESLRPVDAGPALHLPRGLRERVETLLESLGSRLEVVDDRPDPPSVGLGFVGTLRAQQAAAVADLVAHDLGVLVAPPGAGKTVMACAVVAHHDVPTLVVVDRKELVDQWRTRLETHLDIDPARIGQIGGGRNKPGGVVDVAMIQSLARRDDPTVFDGYGLVVVDECHHIPAVSFSACVQHARARRWLGLTATPYRRDKLEALIAFHCGPTRHEIKPGAVDGTELVRRELVVHHTGTEVPDDDAAHIQQVFGQIVADQQRTAQICGDIHRARAAGRTCLVLTQRTDHIDAIVDGLAGLGETALVLRGGLGKRARQAVAGALAARDPNDGLVLVATGSYLGEGFDWPELDTLFLAFPLAFKGRVVQYVGRLLRAHEHKHHVELHDYVDSRIPVLDRMHTKRLPAYATLGFPVPKTTKRTTPRRPADTTRTVDAF